MSSVTVSLPRPVVSAPVRDTLAACGGFALLGAAGALGGGAWPRVPSFALGLLLVPAGAWLVTGLSVLVVHQYLDLDARPESIGRALLAGFVRTGHLAAALVPVALFFTSTSPMWPRLTVGLLCLAGACGLPATARALQAAEPQADHRGFVWLLRGWQLFAALIALRILVDLRP